MTQLHTRQRVRKHGGFTLVEMLVVIAIIGVLVSLLVPAVQAAREASRRSSCLNKLRQLGLAVQSYEGANRYFPSSWNAGAGWSAQARLLPFIEEQSIGGNIDFSASYKDAPTINGQKLSSLRIDGFLCPDENNDEQRIENGVATHYPVNYAVNVGVWFVWDPATNTGGEGAFYPNSRLGTKSFKDGLSKTLCMAEVKAYTPYQRNVATATAVIPVSPDLLEDGGQKKWGGLLEQNTGHTEGVDGRVHQTGFTTTFGPNTVVSPPHATGYDIDWTNQQEGKSPTVRTYAAVTSRSYHPGTVQVVMMDGSAQSVADDVDLNIWRATSTRNGNEAVPAFD